jgi:transposase
MQNIKEILVKESLSQLRLLQKQNPSKYKILQMLILLKQQGCISKYLLAQQLGSSHSSVGKWRSDYVSNGLASLLKENRKGTKKAAITPKVNEALSNRLNNPKEGFRSFIEVQQWLVAEFGIEMEYHAVNKYVKRKFGARLKVSRKSHVLKSPADEAVFKKPVRKAGTY